VTKAQLTFRYVSFAIIATLGNLATQRLVLFFDTTHFGFAIALMLGTGIGLIVKFLLDQRFIFLDQPKSAQQQGQQFALYTVTGLCTTLLFWGTEVLFWWMFKSDLAREAGTIIGLVIGYLVKYQLDRRFVFASPKGAP
jgi:putative flippase GtrA